MLKLEYFFKITKQLGYNHQDNNYKGENKNKLRFGSIIGCLITMD